MKAGDLLQVAPVKTASFGWTFEFYDTTMTHLTPAYLIKDRDEPEPEPMIVLLLETPSDPKYYGGPDFLFLTVLYDNRILKVRYSRAKVIEDC